MNQFFAKHALELPIANFNFGIVLYFYPGIILFELLRI